MGLVMKRTILFISIFLISFSSLLSQWTKLNWKDPSYAYCFLSFENYLFAGCNNGVYISTNNGDSWRKSINGLTYTWMSDLTNLDSEIFAITSNNMFRSTDYGETWVNLTEGTSIMSREAFCATKTKYFFTAVCDGLYESTDKGITWKHGKLFGTINSLQVSDNYIFAGDINSGIKFSNDDGNNWQKLDIPEFVSAQGIYLDCIDKYLFSHQNGILLPNGLAFMSTDKGLSWKKINLKIVYTFNVFGKYIFAGGDSLGLVVSSDEGDTWIEIGKDTLPKRIHDIEFHNQFIFVASPSGIYRSDLTELGFTEVEENNKSKIDLFRILPHPASECLNIKTNFENFKIEIYNSVLEKIIELENSKIIDLSSFTSGIYYCKIYKDNYTETKKFVVIK